MLQHKLSDNVSIENENNANFVQLDDTCNFRQAQMDEQRQNREKS